MVGSQKLALITAALVSAAPDRDTAIDIERWRWAPVVAAGTVHCRVCNGLIDPAAPWNIGSYAESLAGAGAPEHRRCNKLVPARR